MQLFDEIPDFLMPWILQQHMFWVASAPLDGDGLINISPKGTEGTFHVENSRQVWYEDLSGTGVETISHIRENGRVTILFTAFDGPPRIARIYGRGSIHEFGSEKYNVLVPASTRHAGSRAVVLLDVIKIATTCGWSIPFYEFKGHRRQLLEWAAKKEAIDRASAATAAASQPLEDPISKYPNGGSRVVASAVQQQPGMRSWWKERNTTSLEGLPGLLVATVSDGTEATSLRSRPLGEKSSYERNLYVGMGGTSVGPASGKKPNLLRVLQDGQCGWSRWIDGRALVAFLLGVMAAVLFRRICCVPADYSANLSHSFSSSNISLDASLRL